MKTIKIFLASVFATTAILVGLGFGVMIVGFVLTLGAVFALAQRLLDQEVVDDMLHPNEEARAR